VHRIVSDYGGELLMSSARGQGTTVTVKLPAANQEERLRPERGAQSPRESERGWGPASDERRRQETGDRS
jgi:hypothetical protein